MLCSVLIGSVLVAGPQTAAAQTAGVTTDRVSGSSVYELAVNVAGGSCDTKIGSHSVALASGENWPDALAGTALDRPLLLTTQAFLPAVTREYLAPCASHPSAKVIILGGTAAVSEDVAESLRTLGFRVDRISGVDRYDTARKAARIFAPDTLDTVYVASGVNFADAVAVAPSVTKSTPLILTTPKSLHAEARRFLTAADRSINSVTILGGTAAISADVEAEIEALGISTRRIAGPDRYETAALLARESFAAASCHPVVDVAVASGTVPFGGLVAGAVRGPCQPLLLAPSADEAVPEALSAFGQDWLLAIGSSAATVTAIGSPTEIGEDALTAVATGASFSSEGLTGADPAAATQNWEQVAPSVVHLECFNSSGNRLKTGSGFSVGNGRQIVTNYHVVFEGGQPCTLVRVWVGGSFDEAPQRYFIGHLERYASSRDLALLSLSDSADRLPPVQIASGPLRAGESITALGFPGVGGDTMTLTTGRYSGTVDHDGETWLKTDTAIAPGNSGGPAFNAERELVGVPTLLRVASRGGLGVIGSLGLLIPAADVTALIEGRLGERASTPTNDEGRWEQGSTSRSAEPYILLRTTSSRHDIPSPGDHLEPVVVLFCDDDVQIDFWDSERDTFRGPFISGQTSRSDSQRFGRVPVAYRIGGEGESFTRELWWPTLSNRSIVSGDEGASFVDALVDGSGELTFEYTNTDGKSYSIDFPSIDGAAAAHRSLLQRCRA